MENYIFKFPNKSKDSQMKESDREVTECEETLGLEDKKEQ